VPTSN
jgi:hypothetical protein